MTPDTKNVLFVTGVNSRKSQEIYRKALEEYLNSFVPGQAKVYLFDPKAHFKRNWLEHLVPKLPLVDMAIDVVQYMFRYRGSAADEVDRAFLKELEERQYHQVWAHSLGTVIVARNLIYHWDVFKKQIAKNAVTEVFLFQSPLWMPFWRLFKVVDDVFFVTRARLAFHKIVYAYSSKDWISKKASQYWLSRNDITLVDLETRHDFKVALDKFSELIKDGKI